MSELQPGASTIGGGAWPPAEEPYIVVSGLSKSFGGGRRGVARRVFRDFHLQIHRREFLTLFGPNGCGKSTLLRIVAGLDSRYEAGRVEIGGRPPSEARIGFVFQDYQDSLLPWLSSLDNIAFPLELAGRGREERRRRARAALDELEFELPLDRRPRQLSGGQRQLVAIARALIVEPDVLIMDEPFAHLDFESRLRLQLKLLKIWEARRMAVLFVSHDVDEAVLLGERVAVLSGRPAAVGEVVEVPLARPRGYEDLSSPAFFEARRRVLGAYRREVPE